MSTIVDVARRARVSVSTVSAVLNESKAVSPEIRTRVAAAIEELGYRRNPIARSLRSRRTQTIGVVVPDVTIPVFPELLRAVQVAAALEDYEVILYDSDEALTREQQAVLALSDRVDGFVISGVRASTTQNGHLLRLVQTGKPVVFVDRAVIAAGVPTVCINNVLAATRAVEHLIGLGHRRIGLITGSLSLSVNQDRATGYRKALEANGLAYDPELVRESDFTIEGGRLAALSLLQRDDRPTGIFACNDFMAVGVMTAARGLGLQVPGDVSVVGFDNISVAPYLSPPLTTVAQPVTDMGAVAVRLLLNQMEGRKSTDPTSFVLDAPLVVRESTGFVTGGTTNG